MRLSLKVIGILWLGLFLIIGVLLFNAYSKLKPDTFIALLSEQVQKNYPGSKLDVGKVSYRFSLDFNLNLQSIHLRRSDKLLASIGEVELKVPWWLLLSGRGNAQINLKNLDVYVDHASQDSTHDINRPANGGETIKVELPSYLVDANFTLRAKHIAIRDIHSARRYFNVSKLLVREFQYGKNSAFEVNIPVMIHHKGIQYMSDLWFFGDVTPETTSWNLNYRGEFRSREVNDKFQVEDVVIAGKATFVPTTLRVTSDINLEIDKKIVGAGTFTADQELLNLTINLNRFPLGNFGFLNEEIKNPFLSSPLGEGSGTVVFKRSFDTTVSEFSGKISFDGHFFINDKLNIPGSWQITAQDSKWEVSFVSPNGEASFFRRYLVDLKSGEILQFSEEIGFTGLEMVSVINTVASLHSFMRQDPGPHYSTTIAFKRCILGDDQVEGQFKYGSTPDQKFYTGNLRTLKGDLNLNYAEKDHSHSVTLNFKTFTWNSSFNFLLPLFSAGGGQLSGTLEGRWSDNWELGQWLIQISGKELSETNGKIPEFISRTSSFFNLKPEAYAQQSLNLSVKNGLMSINSLMLEGNESAKITGSLSTKQKSFLTLSYPKNKTFKQVKKEVIEPYWMQKEEL